MIQNNITVDSEIQTSEYCHVRHVCFRSLNTFNSDNSFTLYSQQAVTFVKEFNDDDVVQMLVDSLEKNIKEILKKVKFPKE